MEVSKLVVNNIEVPLGAGKPTGLEKIKVSLDRDFTYSGIDTNIDIDLRFWCESGKTEIDAEYESKGVEGSGYVEITDVCGTSTETTRFKLDFKKFKAFANYTTLGLLQLDEINNVYVNWKDDLNKEVNLTTILGQPQDFYIRNCPLRYLYSSQNVYAKINQDTLNTEHSTGWLGGRPVLYNTSPPTTPPSLAPIPPDSIPYPPFGSINYYQEAVHYIMPRVDITRNELENSDGLLMDTFNINGQVLIKTMNFSNVSGTVTSIVGTYSGIEPQPIFENNLSAGEFTINTFNDQLTLDLLDITSAKCELAQINEIISLGKTYENPRYIMKNQLDITGRNINTTTPVTEILTYNKSISLTLEVKELEKVWIYYEIIYKQIEDPAPTYDPTTLKWQYYPYNQIFFKNLSYWLSNTIDIEFKLTKDVKEPILNSSEIVPYHTKTKAYKGTDVLNKIFETDTNIADTICFSDLWFSRGDFIRGKINTADFIVKPSDFFIELEKIVCCGLGVFYDNVGNATKELKSVFDFYTDTLVETFTDADIVDGELSVEPFPSVFYKDISIGYSNSKDSPFELCKQNDYSIDNNSTSRYSKVSDFVSSQYVITRALKLGTLDEEREFDKNIFILSGTTVSAGPTTNYNVTLSQTSGFLSDNIFVSNNNVAGVNRRYATALNLFRHLYKWGFSLFAGKDTLTVNKYVNSNTNTELIRDTTGSSTNIYYQGLSNCKLPLDEFVKHDSTIDNIYDLINQNLYVPSVITFKTTKYTSISLLAMRENQYDLFSVIHNGNTYYGNLISADLEDDVTEIKLLRRFKNGL